MLHNSPSEFLKISYTIIHITVTVNLCYCKTFSKMGPENVDSCGKKKHNTCTCISGLIREMEKKHGFVTTMLSQNINPSRVIIQLHQRHSRLWPLFSSDGFYWAPWSAVTADIYCTALLKVRHATLNWQHGILAAEMFPFTTTHTHMPTVRTYTFQTIHGKFRQEFFNYFSYSPALYLWLLHHTSPHEIAWILMVQGE